MYMSKKIFWEIPHGLPERKKSVSGIPHDFADEKGAFREFPTACLKKKKRLGNSPRLRRKKRNVSGIPHDVPEEKEVRGEFPKALRRVARKKA